MPRAPPPFMVLLGAIALFVFFILYTSDHHGHGQGFSSEFESTSGPLNLEPPDSSYSGGATADAPLLAPQVQHEKPIASKLGNETLKAELGRAAWKLFHTTMARFPDKPKQDESDALKSYIYLFARLYPCGECAEHFQTILKKYPPQTSSRNTAAAWACFVHNEVNISKGKEVFDCGKIGDFYDCGCVDDEEKDQDKKAASKNIRHEEPFEITRDGPMNGG